MLSTDADDGILAGNLLLTGATGFVGAALLAETLLSTDTEVVCLVRAASVHEARERVLAALRPWLGVDRAEASLDRVRALPADITSPGLGLPEPTWNELAEWSTHIVHCAATVRFDEPFHVASAVNVTGAPRVLDLARAATHAGSLARAVMVSTAFVAGTSARAFAEHDLDLGQGFRNTYERSKFEAEREVQRAAAEIPSAWSVPRSSSATQRPGRRRPSTCSTRRCDCSYATPAPQRFLCARAPLWTPCPLTGWRT